MNIIWRERKPCSTKKKLVQHTQTNNIFHTCVLTKRMCKHVVANASHQRDCETVEYRRLENRRPTYCGHKIWWKSLNHISNTFQMVSYYTLGGAMVHERNVWQTHWVSSKNATRKCANVEIQISSSLRME